MATVPKLLPTDAPEPKKESPSKEQLRKDRIVGFIVLLVMAALMSLMIWLVTIGSGAMVNVHEYWRMMP